MAGGLMGAADASWSGDGAKEGSSGPAHPAPAPLHHTDDGDGPDYGPDGLASSAILIHSPWHFAPPPPARAPPTAPLRALASHCGRGCGWLASLAGEESAAGAAIRALIGNSTYTVIVCLVRHSPPTTISLPSPSLSLPSPLLYSSVSSHSSSPA
jgi:hypothetical protein